MERSCLITGAGTYEPYDRIRGMTNRSSGRFALALAYELAKRGIRVTLLAGKRLKDKIDETKVPFKVLPFESASSLQEAMYTVIDNDCPDFIFMAAAVADFRPRQVPGKVSSDGPPPLIEQDLVPKILPTLRERCTNAGKRTFIVGFKLLDDATDEQLYSAAIQQLKKCRTNLCVANDFEQVGAKKDYHPILVVTPEGGRQPIRGHRSDVIQNLVNLVLAREDVHWFHTETNALVNAPTAEVLTQAASLLSFAQRAKLLVDSNGNVSVRNETGEDVSLLVSPRSVDKSRILSEALIPATVNLDTRVISCAGSQKSSIDTGVAATLYARIPDIEALLHFHPGKSVVVPDMTTALAYPCGTVEEANEISQTLNHALLRRHYHGGAFMVELIRHGYLLALETGGVQRIVQQWDDLLALHDSHLRAIGQGHLIPIVTRAPAFVGTEIIAILTYHPDGWVSPYIPLRKRGTGKGEAILSVLEARGETIAVHEKCGVGVFYARRAYLPIPQGDGITHFLPPTRRTDLRKAASICLVNPITRKVLLGKRKKRIDGGVDPWEAKHCCPGGRLEGNETEWEAAQREYFEETGLRPSFGPPVASSTRYTASDDGLKAYQVKNFICFTTGEPQPKETDELSSHWYSFAEAERLSMGHATRAVLLQVFDLVGA